MAILLSICIPTYNRAEYLDISLKHITEDVDFIHRDDIEIIISDNASPDNTKEVCEYYIQKFPDKIKYHRNETNIGNKNFPLVLSMAKGKFAKLHNDTTYFRKSGLKKMLDVIQEHQDLNAIYFSNGDIKKVKDIAMVNNASELFNTGTHWLTWNPSMCYKTDAFKKLENPMRFADLRLAQFDMLLRIVGNTKCLIYNEILMLLQNIPNRAKYSCAQVFGENYFYIIETLIKEKFLSKDVFNDNILKEELEYITPLYFNFRNLAAKEYSKGYFKYLYKYYWNKSYFYSVYFKYLIYKILCLPYVVAQKGLFGFLSQRIMDFYNNSICNSIWKQKNKHNFVQLKNPANYRFVKAGYNSKGLINVLFCGDCSTEILHIGNDVTIEDGVKFILKKDDSSWEKPVFAKSDYILDNDKNEEIVIGDNVTIGANSVIKAGVTISQGSVIQPNSIVDKDI